MSRALIVFAKEPINGTVKTRLKGCFAQKDRILLYKAFVKDTLALAQGVKNTRKILAFASEGVPQYLKSVAVDFEMVEQEGQTLGARMLKAFQFAAQSGAEKTVIIGTDSPTLPARIIEKAFRMLKRNDLVVGPSVDGGYYLIGMKAPRMEIFKGVQWSSASVLKKTLDNAELAGMTTALLDEWYDVDDRMGLERLKNDLATIKDKNIAVNTRVFFKRGK